MSPNVPPIIANIYMSRLILDMLTNIWSVEKWQKVVFRIQVIQVRAVVVEALLHTQEPVVIGLQRLVTPLGEEEETPPQKVASNSK